MYHITLLWKIRERVTLEIFDEYLSFFPILYFLRWRCPVLTNYSFKTWTNVVQYVRHLVLTAGLQLMSDVAMSRTTWDVLGLEQWQHVVANSFSAWTRLSTAQRLRRVSVAQTRFISPEIAKLPLTRQRVCCFRLPLLLKRRRHEDNDGSQHAPEQQGERRVCATVWLRAFLNKSVHACMWFCVKARVSFYMVRYLADLFLPTVTRLLWETVSQAAITVRYVAIYQVT